jgi:hypothetical protein
MANNSKIKALLFGTLLALALSLFFSYPLLPVLLCIALAARLGKSADWRVGMRYGSVIGLSGFVVRITTQENPALAPADLLLALSSAALVFGVVGIGITKLMARGDTIMW